MKNTPENLQAIQDVKSAILSLQGRLSFHNYGICEHISLIITHICYNDVLKIAIAYKTDLIQRACSRYKYYSRDQWYPIGGYYWYYRHMAAGTLWKGDQLVRRQELLRVMLEVLEEDLEKCMSLEKDTVTKN